MASIFSIFKRKEEPQPQKVETEERGLFDGLGLTYGTFSSYSNSKAMRISTAYACCNIISNAVALLPIKVKKNIDGKMVDIEHPLKRVLNPSMAMAISTSRGMSG